MATVLVGPEATPFEIDAPTMRLMVDVANLLDAFGDTGHNTIPLPTVTTKSFELMQRIAVVALDEHTNTWPYRTHHLQVITMELELVDCIMLARDAATVSFSLAKKAACAEIARRVRAKSTSDILRMFGCSGPLPPETVARTCEMHPWIRKPEITEVMVTSHVPRTPTSQ